MKIDNKKIAVAEAILAAGLLYTAGTSNSIIAKTFCASTACYLVYGAYLNSQGRVKLLAEGGVK